MSTSAPARSDAQTPAEGNVFSRAMRPVNTVVERFIPSALVFAIVLTVVVMVGSLLLTDAGPLDVVKAWGDGLAGLLAFMTQMALILLLGYILANTGPVRALLLRLAGVCERREVLLAVEAAHARPVALATKLPRAVNRLREPRLRLLARRGRQ